MIGRRESEQIGESIDNVRWVAMALCLGLLLAGSGRARAGDWQDDYYRAYDRSGAYLGVGGIYAKALFDNTLPLGSELDLDDRDTGGVTARLGYRFHSRLSAEMLFQYYAKFGISGQLDGTGVSGDRFHGWSMALNGRGYLLTGAFQPYAEVGIGGLVMRKRAGDQAAFLTRMGGGVDLYLSECVVLGAEVGYALPAGPLGSFQFMTVELGLTYRY